MKAVQASVALFAFWLVLTGSIAAADLVTGLALSSLLGVLAARLLWTDDAPLLTLGHTSRLLLFVPYLLAHMLLAATHVARIVLDPRMPLAPVTVEHRARFEREVSRVAYANSIGMTPGAVVIDVEDDRFLIHCLDASFADDISRGDLARRISRIFEE